MEAAHPVQMYIYQSNAYRKDLIKLAMFQQWAKDSSDAASEGPTVLHTHFYNLSNNSKKQQFSMYSHLIDL